MAKKTPKTPFIWLSISVLVLIFGFVVLLRSNVLPCANSLTCKESLELNVNNNDLATFNGTNLEPPDIDLAFLDKSNVLGSETNNSDKRIVVDLTSQTLKAYEGDELYFETLISSGKLFPTPTGEFTIWKKIRATKMSGGEGAGYYYLPNVPYVMFFSNSEIAAARGFSLHGTYWHNNFGHAMSHGCVNMRTIDAKKIYDWVNPETVGNDTSATETDPGTKITIYGKAP